MIRRMLSERVGRTRRHISRKPRLDGITLASRRREGASQSPTQPSLARFHPSAIPHPRRSPRLPVSSVTSLGAVSSVVAGTFGGALRRCLAVVEIQLCHDMGAATHGRGRCGNTKCAFPGQAGWTRYESSTCGSDRTFGAGLLPRPPGQAKAARPKNPQSLTALYEEAALAS